MPASVERLLDVEESGGRVATEFEIVRNVLCDHSKVRRIRVEVHKKMLNSSSLLRRILSATLLRDKGRLTDTSCKEAVLVFRLSRWR